MVLKVTVEFAAETVVAFRKNKGKIARPAPDELRFGQGGGADFWPACVTRFVTADNIKQVQYVPAFVEFLDGENCPHPIVLVFERVQENLVLLFLCFFVDR